MKTRNLGPDHAIKLLPMLIFFVTTKRLVSCLLFHPLFQLIYYTCYIQEP